MGLLAMAAVAGNAGATNGYFLGGYGTNSKAEAGVGIALPQDALTVATNPAGLSDVADAFSIGLEVFVPKRGATLIQGGQAADFTGNDTKTFYLPEIGYSRHLSDRLSFGVGLYGNGGLDTDYGTNPFGRFAPPGSGLGGGPTGVNLQQAFLSPALAWRVTDSQSLGLALNIAYQRFQAQGIGLFGGLSTDPGAVSNHGFDSAWGTGVRLGWIGHVGDIVTLGATWQSKTHTGSFKKYAGLFADQGGFDIPSTYGLGIALRPVTGLTVGLDWQRILYGNVASIADTYAPLLQGVLLGASGGPGFGWQDISVIKLGGSYDLTPAVTLRAGVSHSQEPIPTSQTFFNILAPGVIRDHLTAGLSWQLANHDQLNLAYIHAFRDTVYGSSTSVPQPFGGGSANIHLEEDSVAISYSHGLK